jgi:hypothetical protein
MAVRGKGVVRRNVPCSRALRKYLPWKHSFGRGMRSSSLCIGEEDDVYISHVLYEGMIGNILQGMKRGTNLLLARLG